MGWQLLELLVNISSITYGVAGFLAAVAVFAKLSQGPNLDAFPVVGTSTWLGAWWAGFRYLAKAHVIIQQGYDKIAEPRRWTVILSDHRCLEELAWASEDEFSSLASIDDHIQVRYTIGHESIYNPYHISVVRSQITRNIQVLYPEIRDEAVRSLEEVLDLRGHEWKSVPALAAMNKVVCRTSNRLFVGLPLCRNPEWIDLNIRYTANVIKGGIIVGLFPTFMRALATRFLTNIPLSIMRGMKLLGPMIEERLKYLNEYGPEWDNKPNDLLSWLIDSAEGPELTIERLTKRVLIVNFTAIHTSSSFFTQALFYLAANPQYVQSLREEVEGIVDKDGWSKDALAKMRKVDSFLMECQRMEGLNIVTIARKAMKDYTFSDGTFIPKGTSVAAPALSVHHDGDIYENPEVFTPFRFANKREEEGMGHKYQFASTTTEYLPFGYGKHACPGRFFAAYELKSLLAHVVVTYDVKLEDGARCAATWHIGTFICANPRMKIMFRNRDH